MKISPFDITDYEQAVALWQSMDGVSLNESDTPEAIAAFLKRNPGLSYTAKDTNGKVVGTALCGHNGRAGQIYHLAVAPSQRRKGLGRELVELCLTSLAAENIPRCNIFVLTSNDLGNSFWLNTGWNDPTSWKVLQKRISHT